jgi:branched-chain amino acid aminotransferase
MPGMPSEVTSAGQPLEGVVAESILYVNGEFTPARQAKISVFDHVVLYGDGVFDTMVAKHGAVFRFKEHIDRLFESAHAAMLEIPLDRDKLEEIVLETYRRNNIEDRAYIKIVVTRGVGATPLMSPVGCVPGVIVFAVPYLRLSKTSTPDGGISMITSSLRRVPNEATSARIKSCNYLNHVLMRIEATQRGADEALGLDMEGYVCEAPGYNVFVVKNGTLTTPRDNILRGITRQAVIDLAREAGYSVLEQRIDTFDIYTADETFLTSTAGGIIAVGSLDGRQVGTGERGPITRTIADAYDALLDGKTQSTSIRNLHDRS